MTPPAPQTTKTTKTSRSTTPPPPPPPKRSTQPSSEGVGKVRLKQELSQMPKCYVPALHSQKHRIPFIVCLYQYKEHYLDHLDEFEAKYGKSYGEWPDDFKKVVDMMCTKFEHFQCICRRGAAGGSKGPSSKVMKNWRVCCTDALFFFLLFQTGNRSQATSSNVAEEQRRPPPPPRIEAVVKKLAQKPPPASPLLSTPASTLSTPASSSLEQQRQLPHSNFFIPDYTVCDFSWRAIREIFFGATPTNDANKVNIVVQIVNGIIIEIIGELEPSNIHQINFIGLMEKFKSKLSGQISKLQNLESDRKHKFDIVRKVSWMFKQIGLAIYNVGDNLSVDIEFYLENVVAKFRDCAMQLEFRDGNFGTDITDELINTFEPIMVALYEECFGSAEEEPDSTIRYIFDCVIRGCLENVHDEVVELCRMYSPTTTFEPSINLFRSIAFTEICKIINEGL